MGTTRFRATALATAAVISLLLAGCGSSTATDPTDQPIRTTGSSAPVSTAASSPSASVTASGSATVSSSTPPAVGGAVTLVTHDSFSADKAVIAAFEKSSGIKITVLAQGDAGSLVNKLVLTKDNPLGDVVFGIDNAFASRAVSNGVLQPYTSPAAAAGSQRFALPGNDSLTAVDYGDVCVNVDRKYFADKKVAEPTGFEDLAKPEYKDLLVVENPATSSPGLAFLLGTIAHFGEGKWQEYWRSLRANGVKVTSGWTDAYTVDFSGSTGKGARPLVVSYASSPPSEVPKGATVAPTAAVLSTCFRQVEYAGVLAGAKNPEAARKVVDFLLSPQFQAGLAENMYVYPVDQQVKLPADWVKFAPQATDPATIDQQEIADNREKWLAVWSDVVES